MKLSPREKDKLMISMAANVARKRLERGVKLNYPEAIALITDFVIEGARDGKMVSELIKKGDFLNNNPPLYVTRLKKLFTFSASGIISIPVDNWNSVLYDLDELSPYPLMLSHDLDLYSTPKDSLSIISYETQIPKFLGISNLDISLL